jgi:hypothetical protein
MIGKLGCSRIMYLMLCGLFMDLHDSLTLTSLSLLYRFENVLYVRTLFLLQNVLSRMVSPSHDLSRITIYFRF